MNEYVGIDIGGTKIEAVLVDERNTVLNTCRIPARPGAQNVLDDVSGTTRRLGGEPVAVGVGLPGQVDSVTGVVRDIVNLDIVKLELGREASKALGIPVQVENDVNAAALGAVALIDDQVSAGDTVVFLNFGTGLAAGVVRDGHVERGYSGSYGEIGHIPVDPNKFLCNCGQRGCLETVTSGGSVAKLWPGQPPLPDLIEKTKAGEPRAMEVYGIVQHGLADTIQVVGQAYDPKLIVLGGGMAKTGRPLLDMIVEEMRRREETSHFITSLHLPERLRLAPVEQPIGAIGAALAAPRD